jgi:hypothetical protein
MVRESRFVALLVFLPMLIFVILKMSSDISVIISHVFFHQYYID